MSTDNVKIAKPEDIAVITSFAYNAYKDVKLQRTAPDFDKILAAITEAILEDLVFVYKEDGKIKGCIVLNVQEPWWTTELLLSNILMYVDKPYRGTTVINSLLNSVKKYGIMSKMDVFIDVFGFDFDRKGKLLERAGFEQVSNAFYYDSKKEL